MALTDMGEASREFIESDLGKCLMGMADQEVQRAVLEFKDADLTDISKVRALQDRVRAGTWFKEWLIELVQRGEEALSAFRARSTNE